MPYAWEEALGWEQRPPTGDEDLDADDREDFWYHYKSPGLLEANPLGMVPTLVDESGRVVTESAVCVQFVDAVARVRGGAAPPLVDADPFVAARSRCAADKVNRTVCSGYYRVFVRTEDEERKGFDQILDGLSAFFDDDDASDLNGPFWGLVAGPAGSVLFPYAWIRPGAAAGRTSRCRRTLKGTGAGTTRWSRSTPWRARYPTKPICWPTPRATVRLGPRSATRCAGGAAHDYDDEGDWTRRHRRAGARE